MTKFLERYVAGEYEPVWAELLALGAAVREEPLYSDALAVARETMRRARHNIETLIPRLEEIGYQFGYDWLEEDERSFAEGQPPVFAPPKPDVLARISELETLIGTLPLSLRAWYETVGAVNLVGVPPDAWGSLGLESLSSAAFTEFVRAHPDASAEAFQQFEQSQSEFGESIEQDVGRDPLQVVSIEDNRELARRGAAGSPDRGYWLMIAPDHWFKYNTSGTGAYAILMPGPAADAPLLLEWHQTTFVNYLRICFHWGGLPGLERAREAPARELAFLTRDLLPL